MLNHRVIELCSMMNTKRPGHYDYICLEMLLSVTWQDHARFHSLVCCLVLIV